MNKLNLKEFILKRVDDHSGGIKFMELLPDLLTKEFSEEIVITDQIGRKSLNVDLIFEMIKQIPGISVLEYGMDLGDNTFREKFFIYRKLP
jgi:hypothetical protein